MNIEEMHVFQANICFSKKIILMKITIILHGLFVVCFFLYG